MRLRFLDALAKVYPGLGRERILSAVLCGDARIAGERCRDPKRLISAELPVTLDPAFIPPEESSGPATVPPPPWVSRGGYKLESMLDLWGIDPSGKVILDAGASTGGFTHCLLHRGAALVHAVDVGYNQLHWQIRSLPAVRSHERCNIMADLNLDPPPDWAVADLSFRTLVGPAERMVAQCLEGVVYGLMKPQFERRYARNSRGEGFGGVVDRDELAGIIEDFGRRLELAGLGSPRAMAAGLKGSRGNQEFFFEIRSATDLGFPGMAPGLAESLLGQG